jgi:hypothetical protein
MGRDRNWGEEKKGVTVELRAPVTMIFAWYLILDLKGFNLVLLVVIGCFLVSF